MITITNPVITELESYIRYSFDIIDITTKNIYIDVDKKFKDCISTFSDAALIAVLVPAMVEQKNIKIHGKISKTLFDNLSALQDLIIKVIPWLYKISVLADNTIDSVPYKKDIVVTGFSGGVDAFTTLEDYYLKPKYNTQISHLLFNNLIYNDKIANDKFSFLSNLASKVNLPIIKTRTNFHKIYAKKKIGFEQTHPIRNAVIAHLLAAKGIKFLYSSSFPLKDFEIKPWSDIAIVNKVLLPLLSTDKAELVDVGSEYNRVEKMKIISNIKYTRDYLDICIGKKHLKSDFYNCSQCYKCMRALVTFEKLGVLENYNNLFDLNLYRQNKDNYLKKVRRSNQLNDRDLIRFLDGEKDES